MQSTFSRVLGFQEMQPTGSVVAARRLEKTDSVVVADELRRSKTCAIFPDRGANLQLQYRRAGSLLDPPSQGRPSAHVVALARSESEFPAAANRGAGSHTLQALLRPSGGASGFGIYQRGVPSGRESLGTLPTASIAEPARRVPANCQSSSWREVLLAFSFAFLCSREKGEVSGAPRIGRGFSMETQLPLLLRSLSA